MCVPIITDCDSFSILNTGIYVYDFSDVQNSGCLNFMSTWHFYKFQTCLFYKNSYVSCSFLSEAFVFVVSFVMGDTCIDRYAYPINAQVIALEVHDIPSVVVCYTDLFFLIDKRFLNFFKHCWLDLVFP